MTTVSKIAAALLSGTQETTLALANLNFDFSLVKIEAPVEFRGVGAALTTHRRDAAESGSTHITARKLGALFDQAIPHTPNLYEAYGKRASEIAKGVIDDNHGMSSRGIFSDFLGPDATSIWAAATSGRTAIAVHLLACLLARIWKSSEATSIWVEIVKVRQKQLHESVVLDAYQASSVFLASQVSLSREKLAEWDNSARSWLRYADRAHEMEQIKVKLVLDDLKLLISSKPTTYESVIDAWTTALKGMEDLLRGVSQSVSNEGVMLALSSWHLYPDISVHGKAPIMQNDMLFPRGVTVSLHLEGNPSKAINGIYWSLSLSQMRYYGAPMNTQRCYGTETSRLTFSQFLQVVLGSLSCGWGPEGADLDNVAEILLLLNSRVTSNGPPWLRMVAEAASLYARSEDTSRILQRKLVMLGRNRGSSILAEKLSHPLPIFGLTDFSVFVGALRTVEDRVKVLRKYAARFFPGVDPFKVIIRYQTPGNENNLNRDRVDSAFHAVDERLKTSITVTPPSAAMFEKRFPTTVPAIFEDDHTRCDPTDLTNCLDYQSTEYGDSSTTDLQAQGALDRSAMAPGTFPQPKRPRSEPEATSPSRVTKRAKFEDPEESQTMPNGANPDRPMSSLSPFINDNPMIMSSVPLVVDISVTSVEDEIVSEATFHGTIDGGTTGLATALPYVSGTEQQELHYFRWADQHVDKLRHEKLVDSNESILDRSELNIVYESQELKLLGDGFRSAAIGKSRNETNEIVPGKSVDTPSVVYKFFLGNESKAAIFVEADVLATHEKDWKAPLWARLPKIKRRVDVSDVKEALENNALDLTNWPGNSFKQTRYYDSLSALSSAWELYKGLANATISPDIVGHPVFENAWAKELSRKARFSMQSQTLTRGQAFSCIANFETGGIDLPASRFANVMALSSGDSIYVSSRLVCDPAESQSVHTIVRLSGNVGKPGLVLLVPPAEPLVLKPNHDNWRVIDRDIYTGQREDYFGNTSLHLSFTDWSIPIDLGETKQGRRDIEAHIVESLVSVSDNGRWIADLDILSALNKGSSQPDHRYFFRVGCTHKDGREVDLVSVEADFYIIKNWDEFLEPPECPAVVKANDNWEAKLAFAAIGVQRGYRVFVSKKVCDLCLDELQYIGGSKLVGKALFLV